MEVAVAKGMKALDEPDQDTRHAVLIYDGRITLPDVGKIDALLLHVRDYSGPAPRNLRMAVPYRHRKLMKRFAVFRPKFLDTDVPDPDYAVFGNAFFAGVDSHEQGAKFWNKHMDQSL
jgi:hypothetical protein